MQTFKKRLSAMFMSREQVIYLISLFVNCVVYGGFAATFTYQQIGLGTKFYSINLMLGCVIGLIHAYISTDLKKKRWVFKHFKAIDICETLFFTVTECTFAAIYFIGGFDPKVNEKSVLELFFCWNMFYRIIGAIINTVIPGIGNVYEQSLYKNQLDYQNHSNAEDLMCCFGAIGGAMLSFIIGDYIKWHPYWIFSLQLLDWYELWSRWQFYFKKENYDTIKRNFARDCMKWQKKLEKS